MTTEIWFKVKGVRFDAPTHLTHRNLSPPFKIIFNQIFLNDRAQSPFNLENFPGRPYP